MSNHITTAEGTTVTLEGKNIILSHKHAPEDLANFQAGRVVYDGQGFQPSPLFPVAMRSSVLRAIADLIDNTKEA